jgi:hypothetical protein
MQIINCFHGAVFIFDQEDNKILFQNEMMRDMNMLEVKDRFVQTDRAYKILPNFALNKGKKDAVRLYENADSVLAEKNEGE